LQLTIAGLSFGFHPRSLDSIALKEDLWEWLEVAFLPSMLVNSSNLMTYNVVLGGVLLEQTRTETANCDGDAGGSWRLDEELPFLQNVSCFPQASPKQQGTFGLGGDSDLLYYPSEGFVPLSEVDFQRRLRAAEPPSESLATTQAAVAWSGAANYRDPGTVPRRLGAPAETAPPRRARAVAQLLTVPAGFWDANQGAVYPFFFHLSDPFEVSKARLNYLRENQWLDAATSSVAVRMMFVNAEMGVVGHLNIVFTMSRTGAVFAQSLFSPIYLASYSNPIGYFFDAGWIGLLLWEMLMEAGELRDAWKHGNVRKYFSNKWNALDWIHFTIGLCLCAEMIWQEFILSSFRASLEVFTEGFIAPDQLSAVQDAHTNATDAANNFMWFRLTRGVFMLIATLRFLKSFEGNPRLAVVTRTVEDAATDLVHFGVVFLCIFISYAAAGHMIFGYQHEGFCTFYNSFCTCFATAMGQFEWPEELGRKHPIVSTIWFITFQCFVTLVLLNMVLAIMLDASKVTRDRTIRGDAGTLWFQISDTVKRFVLRNSWVSEDQFLHFLEGQPAQQVFVMGRQIREAFPDIPAAQIEELYDAVIAYEIHASRDSIGIRDTAQLIGATIHKIEELKRDLPKKRRLMRPQTRSRGRKILVAALLSGQLEAVLAAMGSGVKKQAGKRNKVFAVAAGALPTIVSGPSSMSEVGAPEDTGAGVSLADDGGSELKSPDRMTPVGVPPVGPAAARTTVAAPVVATGYSYAQPNRDANIVVSESDVVARVTAAVQEAATAKALDTITQAVEGCLMGSVDGVMKSIRSEFDAMRDSLAKTEKAALTQHRYMGVQMAKWCSCVQKVLEVKTESLETTISDAASMMREQVREVKSAAQSMARQSTFTTPKLKHNVARGGSFETGHSDSESPLASSPQRSRRSTPRSAGLGLGGRSVTADHAQTDGEQPTRRVKRSMMPNIRLLGGFLNSGDPKSGNPSADKEDKEDKEDKDLAWDSVEGSAAPKVLDTSTMPNLQVNSRDGRLRVKPLPAPDPGDEEDVSGDLPGIVEQTEEEPAIPPKPQHEAEPEHQQLPPFAAVSESDNGPGMLGAWQATNPGPESLGGPARNDGVGDGPSQLQPAERRIPSPDAAGRYQLDPSTNLQGYTGTGPWRSGWGWRQCQLRDRWIRQGMASGLQGWGPGQFDARFLQQDPLWGQVQYTGWSQAAPQAGVHRGPHRGGQVLFGVAPGTLPPTQSWGVPVSMPRRENS